MPIPSKAFKQVYTIVNRTVAGQTQKIWLRVGAAFENEDGSWNIQLDAIPTSGQLFVRDSSPKDQS